MKEHEGDLHLTIQFATQREILWMSCYVFHDIPSEQATDDMVVSYLYISKSSPIPPHPPDLELHLILFDDQPNQIA